MGAFGFFHFVRSSFLNDPFCSFFFNCSKKLISFVLVMVYFPSIISKNDSFFIVHETISIVYRWCSSLSIKRGYLRLKGTVSVISSDRLQCPINIGKLCLIQYDLDINVYNFKISDYFQFRVPYYWSVKGFKGTFVNRALPPLHWESLDITFTVPLIKIPFTNMVVSCAWVAWGVTGSIPGFLPSLHCFGLSTIEGGVCTVIKPRQWSVILW